MTKFTSNPIHIPMVLRTAGLANVNSARFGMVRNGGTRAHQGIDLAVNPNFRIRAVENGTVVMVQNLDVGDHGLFVGIRLNCPEKAFLHNRIAFYSHLSRVDVRLNQVVTAGEILGLTGHSGNARSMRTIPTGSHLHFELRTVVNAGLGLQNRIDPEPFVNF